MTVPSYKTRLAAAAVTLSVAASAAVFDLAGAAGRQVPVFRAPSILSAHQPIGRYSNVFGRDGGRSTNVATDGQGSWIAVWHSSVSLGGYIGKDWDILFSRSTDNGKTWTPHTPIAANASADTGYDLAPVISTDGRGTWIAAWSSNESFGGSLARDKDLLFVRSTDGGQSWSAPRPLNTNGGRDQGNDIDVRLANDGAGNWLAVWSSTDSLRARIGGDADILMARSQDDGETWSAPVPVASNAANDAHFDAAPDIATDRSGRWGVVWSSGDSRTGPVVSDRRILFVSSDDTGASWSPPQAITAEGSSRDATAWTPSLTTDGRGNWATVWSSAVTKDGPLGFDRDIMISRSNNNAASWDSATALNANATEDSREDLNPLLLTNGRGTWVAIWHTVGGYSYNDGNDADITMAYSSDRGRTWSAPEHINRAAVDDSVDDLRPGAAVDRAGRMVAVWQSVYPVEDRRIAEWRVIASAGTIEEPAGPAPDAD